MKIRKGAAAGVDKVEMQMTPMIDIVFQLLTFFLFSFKIVSPEGDFNIKMPVATQSNPNIEEPMLPIKLHLIADEDGKLAGIAMNDRPIANFEELRTQVASIVGGEAGPNSAADTTEVELDCDYKLKYEYVIDAITAVSGYREGDHIVKLIQKIRFTPPRRPG
jgi:biopolymer transport protein ExbD